MRKKTELEHALQQADNGRDTVIDLVKTWAILGVILIHAASGVYYAHPSGTFHWMCALFWRSVVSPSVPLFLMCSGVLFLSPAKSLSLKQLYTGYIPRLLAAMVVWGMAYKVYHLILDGGLSLGALWYSLKRVLLLDQEFHLYYIPMILLVYAFLPLTRRFTAAATKRELEYALALWAVLGIVYPTLRLSYPLRLVTGIGQQYMMNMTYASVGYGLLGYYLANWPIGKWMSAASAVGGLLVVFLGTWRRSIGALAPDPFLLEGMSMGVCLLAVGTFGLAIQLRRHLSAAFVRASTYISKGSFCVYLVHVFFVYLLHRYGMDVLALCPLLTLPLLSAAILAVSLCVYAMLSKVPVVRKWLI